MDKIIGNWKFAILNIAIFVALPLKGQNVYLSGQLEDAFLKTPLVAKVAVYRSDSTLVTDSVNVMVYTDRSGRMLSVQYTVSVDAREKTCLVRASLEGYDEAWQKVNIPDTYIP